jgi:ABC-type transport system involved in multi-copper enzyme maturation permease subunit
MNTFTQVLRSEFTKLRTVRGWIVAIIAGAGAIMALGLLAGAQGSCGQHGAASECVLPVGPGGEEVSDSFTFVYQSLAGDGSITARVTSLTGLLPATEPGESRPGAMPWSKAGLIIKAGTASGSTYAAIMVTGGNGVRMQYDYTHDRAGTAGAVSADAPRWLRLTRGGDTVTGAESADGHTWTTVDTAKLTGLPPTVEIGLFATSPQYAEQINEGVLSGSMGGPTQATGTFDHLSLQAGSAGQAPAGNWKGESLGAPPNLPPVGRFEQVGDVFTVTGSGDIAPAVPGATGIGASITQTLVGTFVGLIVVVVIGVMFITGEYRRGLIRTTLTANPRRGQVLGAKAVVIAAVTFVTGLVAAAVVVVFGQRVLRDNGVYVHPVSTSTELRVIVGTAALLALAAVLALALGALLRRSVTAVTTAVVVIVLPYLLAMTVLPAGAAQWLLRVSPAAAFALQQAAPEYPQVANLYTPANGYFPLAPWAGFAVLAGWAALALCLAAFLLRRRDV